VEAEEVGLIRPAGQVGVAVAEGWRLADRAVGRGARAHLLRPGSPGVFTVVTRDISHGSAPSTKPPALLYKAQFVQLQGPAWQR
jgi:hypothetical protein